MSRRSPRAARARLVPTILLLAGAACSGDDDGLVLRPGDSLLDHVDGARVVAMALTALPEDVLAALARPEETLEHSVPADAWGEGRPVRQVPAMQSRILGATEKLRRFEASLPWPLDAPGTEVELRVGGAPVERADAKGHVHLGEGDLAWAWEGPVSACFYESERGALVVYSRSAPTDLSVTVTRRAPRDVRRYEPEGLVVRRIEVARVSRPCLVLPAPSAVEFALSRLDADALELAVAVPDHGWRVERDALLPAPGIGDGVTFAVEVDTTEGARRIWSRHVVPGASFEEHRVPLGDIPLPATLRFVTEPGPAGDPRFDYGLIAGLRLSGDHAGRPTRPHVVLIDVDTLRADRLGCYGAARPTTPRLDRWADREAVLFEDAQATASWTLPSTLSMLTGLAVQQHRVYGFETVLTDPAPLLAVTLGEAGYETYAMTDGGYVSPGYGFDAGFDVFDHRRQQFSGHADPEWDQAVRWLEGRRSERPAFVFLQTYLVHAPFPEDRRFEDAAAPYDGSLAGEAVGYDNVIRPFRGGRLTLSAADREHIDRLYDAGVARMDDAVGDLLDALPAVFGDDPYLVIFTSDHGEELFEHGSLTHGRTLYEEVLRVPLIVRLPDGRAGRSTAPVSLLDVVPTVLDVAGLPQPPSLPGRSLARDPAGEVVRLASGASTSAAVTASGWKLIRKQDEVELFDLRTDPGERNDLSADDPATVDRLTGLLDEFVKRHPPLERDEIPEADLDEALLEDLRALGYLGDDG